MVLSPEEAKFRFDTRSAEFEAQRKRQIELFQDGLERDIDFCLEIGIVKNSWPVTYTYGENSETRFLLEHALRCTEYELGSLKDSQPPPFIQEVILKYRNTGWQVEYKPPKRSMPTEFKLIFNIK